MNNPTLYRSVSAVLILSILIGVTVPAGLHAAAAGLCDGMNMSDHSMMSPVMDGDHTTESSHPSHKSTLDHASKAGHDFGEICACHIKEAPVKTEIRVLDKTEVQALSVAETLLLSEVTKLKSHNHLIPYSDLYAPPPIYLLKGAFLN